MLNHLRLEKPQPTGTGIAEGEGILDLASREYELQLDGKNLQATTLQLPGDVCLAGRFGFKATGKGTFDNPSFQLKLEGGRTGGGEIPGWQPSDACPACQPPFHRRFGSAFASSAGEGPIGTQDGYPIQFEIVDSHTPLNLIREGNALVTGFFDALITGRGLLSNLETLEASASIQRLELKLREQEVHNGQPVEIRYGGQRLNILNLALESGDSRFQISGALPLRADVPSGDLTLRAHLNLDTIRQPAANGELSECARYRRTQWENQRKFSAARAKRLA